VFGVVQTRNGDTENMKFEDLQKDLEEWWNNYNHLLGDASGDSECKRKLHRIVKLMRRVRV